MIEPCNMFSQKNRLQKVCKVFCTGADANVIVMLGRYMGSRFHRIAHEHYSRYPITW
jgi:hypothetical protein